MCNKNNTIDSFIVDFYSSYPSAEYSFCKILAIAAKKASTKEIKNLWDQKINGGK